MRVLRFCVLLAVCVVPGAAPAAVPDLLETAFRKIEDDAERWAYTKTTQEIDRKGRIEETQVVRVDPSEPFDGREILISQDGEAATEKQQAKFLKDRLKTQERRERRRQKQGMAGEDTGLRSELRRWMGLESAKVISEDPTTVTYEVPILSGKEQPYPPEKFELWFTVNREKAEFTKLSFRLKESLRAKLVAKVKRAGMEVRFAHVDLEHAATAVLIEGSFEASLLFVPVGEGMREERTDFRRVTPYDERFQVNIGETKTVDFLP